MYYKKNREQNLIELMRLWRKRNPEYHKFWLRKKRKDMYIRYGKWKKLPPLDLQTEYELNNDLPINLPISMAQRLNGELSCLEIGKGIRRELKELVGPLKYIPTLNSVRF